MAKLKNKKPSQSFSTLWVLTLGTSLTTLYFNSKIQDPFNSPKLWILMILGSWMLGHLLVNLRTLGVTYTRETLIAVIFLFAGLISLILTSPLYTGFFGETQRRNGYLSYLLLTIVLLSGMININFYFIKKFGVLVITVGLVLSVYGLMQISGLDFVKWNNPYNAVISTVGNPNFAAAIMAIMATLNFGFFLNTGIASIQRALHCLVFVLSLIAIFSSDARQGLVSLALGIGTILIVFIHSKNRIIGWMSAFLGIVIGAFSMLGMLQTGPLTNLLYKDSVSVRGYYWRAGIEMFKDHLLFGVGQDRYGAFFKQYRESNYSLNYGFDITSSNAHNVPIQLFATGGVFVGIAYIALISIVVISAIIGVKKSIGENRLVLTTIFAGWLAYQAQSFVSIDNLGISVWGWLLSGFVIGLSAIVQRRNLNQEKPVQKNYYEVKIFQPLISGALVVASFILISTLYRGENAMFQTRIRFNPQDTNSNSAVLEFASKSLKTPLIEPAYKIASINYLSASGFTEKALEEFNSQLKYDPRNLDVLNPIAELNEKLARVPEAITARESIRKLDPWNSRNLLQLGREYKFLGNFEMMEEIKKAILEFDSISKESEAAKTELVAR